MKRYFLWAAIIVATIVYFFLGLRYGLVFLNYVGISFSDASTIIEVLRSLIETIAIIVAGVWTYERFIKSREDYPYPKIQHRTEHYVLENNTIYLSVFVTVTNEGKTKLDLGGGKIFVRQVSPLAEEIKKPIEDAVRNSQEEDIRLGNIQGLFRDTGQRLGWLTLGSREWKQLRGKLKELEPGQTREIQFDFLLLERNVKVLEIISYFEYAQSSWELATLYSLKTVGGASSL